MKTRVQADNSNGVYAVLEFDGEVMTQDDFYDSLKNNPDDITIRAELDEAMVERVEAEYGIRNA